MSNSISVGSITSTSAVITINAVNDFGVTVRVFLLLREGDFSGNATALESSSYVVGSYELPAGINMVDVKRTVTGLKTSTTYSYQWSMTRGTTIGSAIDRRRPLSPPATFATLPPAPNFTSTNIPNTATVGVAYSGSVSASNTTSYSVSSGALPTGITLNSSTGAITGTPTTVQTATFRIRATGPGGTATTSERTITVNPDAVAPTWTDNTLSGDLRVGIAYSDGVQASGTTPTYSVSAGTLPTGLSLNTSTGAVTGTPTAQGSFTFTLQASNVAGSITQGFTLAVKPGGRRWDGSDWVRVTTLKRYDGSAWVDVAQVKRFDGSNFIDANE
jgi:hypothetical protein